MLARPTPTATTTMRSFSVSCRGPAPLAVTCATNRLSRPTEARFFSKEAPECDQSVQATGIQTDSDCGEFFRACGKCMSRRIASIKRFFVPPFSEDVTGNYSLIILTLRIIIGSRLCRCRCFFFDFVHGCLSLIDEEEGISHFQSAERFLCRRFSAPSLYECIWKETRKMHMYLARLEDFGKRSCFWLQNSTHAGTLASSSRGLSDETIATPFGIRSSIVQLARAF
jgi:hypothetical protein